MKAQAEKEAAAMAKKEKIAAAGGQMVHAAFAFMGEIFAENDNDAEIEQLAGAFKAKLGDCLEKSDDGQIKMTIALPDETFLDTMARSMARMAQAGRR
jgi:hypothetical protein